MSKGAAILKQYLKFVKSGQGFEHVLKNINFTALENGNATAEIVVDPLHTNYFQQLHGGFSATLVDIVSGCALLSHEKGAAGVSVNINLTYIKSAKIGETILVEARTVKTGKNLGFLEVEIKNKSTGEVLVTGTHTKFIGMG